MKKNNRMMKVYGRVDETVQGESVASEFVVKELRRSIKFFNMAEMMNVGGGLREWTPEIDSEVSQTEQSVCEGVEHWEGCNK
jgi:hypothetical protein